MFNFFEDNEKIRHKRKLNELMDKYGESTRAISENSTLKDFFEYQFAQPDRYFNEVLEDRKKNRAPKPQEKQQIFSQNQPTFKQKIKNAKTIAKDTIKYGASEVLDIVEGTLGYPGELAADVQIAKKYYDKMNAVGNQLVTTYGAKQGADIDNYYHPLLQCELSKIGSISQTNGILLGYTKEAWDGLKKFIKMPLNELKADCRKDLNNNSYGSLLGKKYPYKSCEELLDDKRTHNMRKSNIR